MKTPIKCIGLALLFAASAGVANAQYVPTHPKYVEYISGGQKFTDYFPTWEPGQQLSEDENFFISRVKYKERFVNRNSQIVPDNEYNNQRKFSLCTPMGISDTYWQTLPRGVMDGDTFGMWSYIDYQDGWSQSWIRNVGAYSDVCHKNGVQNSGGVVFFDSWGGDNTNSNATVNLITQKNSDGSWKYLDKFMKFLRYYGVDGVTFNPEGTVPNASALQDFFIDCHKWADEHGTKFHVCWYGTSQNSGYMDLGSTLTAGKSNWFVKNGKEVCDVYFLNYDWHQGVATSINQAEKLLKGSANNLFGGYDIQGNWMGRATWTTFKNNAMSICFWGNHTTDMIYQNSTELGSTDEAVQRNYMQKQEQVFSGGNRNPANTPAIKNGVGSSSTAAMKSFHGVAALMPARSSLQELPFITRFSIGSGKAFRYEGNETFHSKWYGLATQDYLPTWRWWITDKASKVPTDAVECDFTFDDSWYAGSCLRVKGATESSNIRLFKTNFQVSASDDVNLIFKLAAGNDSHARLFWSFVGSENELHFADVTGGKQGEWAEWQKTAGELGMEGNVAVLGLAYDNTPAGYEMLVGELGIVPQVAYNPVQPKITVAKILDRTFSNVNYKLIWDCGKSEAAKADASMPTYNEDVDTWYFEVYSQPKGGEATLDAMTTSWAHYVVGAYGNAETTEYRFGVRAVAPDGKTATDIVWSDWLESDVTFVEGVTVDRPVIKPGEEFNVTYTDPLHPAAAMWQIVDSEGNDVVTPAKEATGISGKIDNIGTYDLIISQTDEVGDAGGSTGAPATPVLSAADLVADQAYYISTAARGGLTVKDANDTRIWGTQESGVGQKTDNKDPRQQFKFVEQGGNYYLYNVATKKYVSATNTGTLTAEPKSPIYFVEGNNGTVRLKFSDSFNINLGGSCQVTIDTWSKKDDGNSFVILPISADVAGEVQLPLIYRGLIQVSPEETGALPTINDFTAEETALNEDNNSTVVKYDIARLGEGKVSRGLQMEDASQFRIPKEALPASQNKYSVGFWIKPDKFAHSKYGTNLINKRNVGRNWPHNNWGAFWVIVWPEWKNNSGDVVLDDNVISYTMYSSTNSGSLAGNSNIHETPFYSCVTDRQHPCGQTYALVPGTWSHVMITYDGSSQSIYFNGKLAVKTQTRFVEYDESPIYIGGSNVYHAGINGTIDDVQVWHKALNASEVQEAMKGYEGKTVPAELKAYYTFESFDAQNNFPNLGAGAATMKGAYVNLEGAAGENTTGTVEVTLKPNTEVLGNPTLPGSLEVGTKVEFTVPLFDVNGTTESAIITAPRGASAGYYDATLKLTNMWGEATLTKPGYITYGDVDSIVDGIESVKALPAQNAAVFNLQGQRVNSAVKGVYIVNGKKIVK